MICTLKRNVFGAPLFLDRYVVCLTLLFEIQAIKVLGRGVSCP